MKKIISLGKVKVDGGELDYADMLKQIVSATPQGADYKEMVNIVRLCELIDEADGSLTLSPDDYRFVSGKVKNHKFPSAHKEFVKFVDTVLDAKDAPEEKSDKKAAA